jgi:hypothetical protein
MPATDESLTCTMCGCSSTWKAAFRRVKDGTLRRLCCPYCADNVARKHARARLLLQVFASSVWLAILSTGHFHHGNTIAWIVASYCLISMWMYLLIIPHEWGHALVARLVGAPCHAIQIGEAPWLLDRRISGIRWRIGRYWSGGFTLDAPCEGPKARRNGAFIVLGGPTMNLLIAAIAITAFHLRDDPASSVGNVLLLTLGMASGSLFISNLWPRRIRISMREMYSDGANLLRILRGERRDPRAGHAYVHYSLARLAFDDRDFTTAAREAAAARGLWPDEPGRAALTVTQAAALAESDDAAGAVRLLSPLLELPSPDPGVRAGVADNLAWAFLLLGEPHRLEQGLKLVAEARMLAPWDRSFLITEVSLLAASANPENGRVEVAQELLRQLDAEKLRGQNAAYAALARGLIAAARGDASARREYHNAESLHATAAPLRVLERRLPSR